MLYRPWRLSQTFFVSVVVVFPIGLRQIVCAPSSLGATVLLNLCSGPLYAKAHLPSLHFQYLSRHTGSVFYLDICTKAGLLSTNSCSVTQET